MNTERIPAIAALISVILVALLSLTFGSPTVLDGDSFGDVLRAFAADSKIVVIFALILVDVLIGIIAAVRIGIFDAQRLGDFYVTNVIKFIGGYGLFYAVVRFGINAYVPVVVGASIHAIGYSFIIVALLSSIFNNARRAYVGSTIPDTVAMSTIAPSDAQG